MTPTGAQIGARTQAGRALADYPSQEVLRMLTGINLVLLGIAFVTLAFWLLRRRARIENTSLSLNQESTPR